MTVLFFRRIFFFTRIYFWVRFFRIRTFTICCCYVHNFTCKNVGFRHCVFCCKFSAFARCKGLNGPYVFGKLIGYNHICQCQVAIVGCNNLVSNCFAKGIGFSVCRCPRCILGDCQMTVRIFEIIYGICIFKVFAAIKACCDFVCKCSCQKICFSNYIFCSCCYFFSRSNVFKYRLSCNCYAFLFGNSNGFCFIVDIRYFNIKYDCIA